MNPIVNQMNNMNPMDAMMQPLFQAMRTAQNPMAALGQMVASNPQMQDVITAIQQNGTAQQAFYNEAQKRNANTNDILRQAQQMMQTFPMR